MSVAEDERRASDRATSYLFRMSHADKAKLHRRAREAGMSIQGYLEHIVLGHAPMPPRPSGRRRHEIQGELEISA